VVEAYKFTKQNIQMTGTIKTVTDRGFGFIAVEGESKDIFFHSKDLNGVTFDELKAGDAVTFEVSEGPKGPAATNVSRA
jgi:CspA family cold shock protein